MKAIRRIGHANRLMDYSLLLLSLAGLLIAYEMVLGCGGSTPQSARFDVLDDNPKDPDGRLELSDSDSCSTVQVSNEVELNDVKDCDSCGLISWQVLNDGGAEVTLGSTGVFTLVEICRGDAAQERTAVLLRGTYRLLTGHGDRSASITRRIPLRIRDGT